MRHDPARVEETRTWLSKAHNDLRAADLGRQVDPPLLEDVAFHAQQVAEKALKAFLVWHDHPFTKTHDLAVLARDCATVEPGLDPLRNRVAPLTEYAWKYRYPLGAEPTVQEAQEALEAAREAYEAILDRLPEEARP